MTTQRYNLLSENLDERISPAEAAEGWHWCGEFDGLLVGPGMSERQFCQTDLCPLVPLQELLELQKRENQTQGEFGI